MQTDRFDTNLTGNWILWNYGVGKNPHSWYIHTHNNWTYIYYWARCEGHEYNDDSNRSIIFKNDKIFGITEKRYLFHSFTAGAPNYNVLFTFIVFVL